MRKLQCDLCGGALFLSARGAFGRLQNKSTLSLWKKRIAFMMIKG